MGFLVFIKKYVSEKGSLKNSDTVWCNQMGIIFAEMSSCAALTCHTGIKTVF